ncbi:MAG: hypothetical protein A2086_06300 [Spirochaetes bacterium GWD1_27_9]|nr:MAG: hypothetical protein A2Z98_05405 [Spirochaetes bacterium GWB1_27_13]OHD30876.1 MAG: hypothetical protein A2086_06300 [Spirochaetes bacterium GWD1_27_9]
MSQQQLLIDIISILENLNIQYMLTGSTVSSVQGEPRSTHDIDIIISINKEDIEKIYMGLKNDSYYIDLESIKDAIENKSMFNLIDMNEGDKVDFWLLTNTPFDKKRFERKIKTNIFNKTMYVSSYEDTILMKLKWSKDSFGSKKQYIDALRVYEINKDLINNEYLLYWSKILDIEDLLEKMLSEVVVFDKN